MDVRWKDKDATEVGGDYTKQCISRQSVCDCMFSDELSENIAFLLDKQGVTMYKYA
ncbi:MAG: hypothetical protein Q4D54_10535 [Eubacteriales bacterium]|nr:hypothetical protein [Eubacteriales bacterium]